MGLVNFRSVIILRISFSLVGAKKNESEVASLKYSLKLLVVRGTLAIIFGPMAVKKTC